MKSIDLVLFADHSQKLPSALLEPRDLQGHISPIAKILMAHFIDFFMALAITTTISQSFNLSFKLLLSSKLLKSAMTSEHSASFTVLIFPLVLLCYFALSYFMNHGQTWGMFLVKSRISLRDRSFKDTVLWGCYSFSICFSGGISILLLKNMNIKASFQGHDYLYQDLMTPKFFNDLCLVDETLKLNSHTSEEYKIAA